MVTILAHRGSGVTMHQSAAERAARRAASIPYENSLAALIYGITMQQADGVELDVIACKDAVVVVHDGALKKHFLNAPVGSIEQYSVRELKQWHMGDEGTHIATLDEVMTALAPHQPLMNIELKGAQVYGAALHVVQQHLKKGSWQAEQLLFSSFDHTQLHALAEKHLPFRLGALYEPAPAGEVITAETLQRAQVDLQPFSHHVCIDDVLRNPLLVEVIAGLKSQLVVWTMQERPPHIWKNPVEIAYKTDANA